MGTYESYTAHAKDSIKLNEKHIQDDNTCNAGFWSKLLQKDYEKQLEDAKAKEEKRLNSLGRGKRVRNRTSYYEGQQMKEMVFKKSLFLFI